MSKVNFNWKLVLLIISFSLISFSGCDNSNDNNPSAPPEEPDFIISEEAVIIDSLEVSEPQIEDSIFVFTYVGSFHFSRVCEFV